MNIEENKNRFLDLINSIQREGMNKDLLIKQLTESDFFTAPASTKYHSCERGGLCQHSLNVYDELVALNERYGHRYDDDSIKIVALFHDFSKMNFYESYVQNKKVYSETGSKYDNMGKYDWKSIEGWKVRENNNVFIYADHGQNSEYMTRTFIPLTLEESCAITNHHSAFGNPNLNVTPIFNRFNLACLLHVADVLATYIVERIDE